MWSDRSSYVQKPSNDEVDEAQRRLADEPKRSTGLTGVIIILVLSFMGAIILS